MKNIETEAKDNVSKELAERLKTDSKCNRFVYCSSFGGITNLHTELMGITNKTKFHGINAKTVRTNGLILRLGIYLKF